MYSISITFACTVRGIIIIIFFGDFVGIVRINYASASLNSDLSTMCTRIRSRSCCCCQSIDPLTIYRHRYCSSMFMLCVLDWASNNLIFRHGRRRHQKRLLIFNICCDFRTKLSPATAAAAAAKFALVLFNVRCCQISMSVAALDTIIVCILIALFNPFKSW